MPDISVTEAQHDRLEAVRRDVEEAYVGEYGHARLEDAVQYLLDTYTPPEERDRVEAYDRIATADYPTLQRVASDVEGVPGSGIDADEMRGRLLSELGPDVLATELAAATEHDAADGSAQADAEQAATEEAVPDEETTGAESGPTRAESAADIGSRDAQQTDIGPDEGTADAGTGRDSILASANELLGEHDDKWRESDGETRYEVDLPDGSTEPARTKDDVRRLLFRHY